MTVTKRMTSGFFKYDLKSVSRPDGTFELYDYATNGTYKTTTVWSGQPGDTANTNVVAGTKSVTVVGLAGQMMTNQVYDVASGATMAVRGGRLGYEPPNFEVVEMISALQADTNKTVSGLAWRIMQELSELSMTKSR